jgi:DNA-binding GntR family transcriptional regulator
MQTTSLLIDRPNISDALVAALRGMILDGRLPAGERINEVQLAASNGVSRTPLREALGRLVAEGELTAVPRIGFFVCPLTLEEFAQIYPIRAILDPEALQLAGIPSREILRRLKQLNQQIASAREPAKVIELDDSWHRQLLARCPNRVLLDLIEQFIRRTRRYDIALMRESRHVVAATEIHEEIMTALQRGDLSGACVALRRNLQAGFKPVVEWLKQRQTSPDPNRVRK